MKSAMNSIKSIFVPLLLASAGVIAGEISVSDGRVRETIPGQAVSVGYLRIANNGDISCSLVSVNAPTVGRIEVHEHRHQNGKMSMREVVGLTVDANETVTFEPGGYHLMLLDLPQPLVKGATVTMNFDFGDCGLVTEVFPVMAVGN